MSAPLSASELQAQLLQEVSRTFALTIPQLPPALSTVVSNAYLLCRIVDTIEDEPALTAAQKRHFCDRFVDVVHGSAAPDTFADDLAPLLSGSTIPAEHELVRQVPQVLTITAGFDSAQREALQDCIDVMAQGMAEFQENKTTYGLRDLSQLDRYCYCVAGVVGETLTRLFCGYSAEIAANEAAMMKLAVSFGQGLQMTNILKDIWDDQTRGACWLPDDIFRKSGFDLRSLSSAQYDDAFGRGLSELVGIATEHLNNALKYTLMIPKHETGVRHFCLWAIGMALLTLHKINNHPNFRTANEVKISRRSVMTTVAVSRVAATHNRLLKAIFKLLRVGLPQGPSTVLH